MKQPPEGIKTSSCSLQLYQRYTRLNFRIATNYFEQQMIKYPGRAEFHSLAEYYHAALLEGDPLVSTYVPQPYELKLHGKRYVPDIYYVRDDVRYVGELKPEGEFPDEKRIPLEAFFAEHDMHFIVISNEAVFERNRAAENWRLVVQHLLCNATDLDTDDIESQILLRCLQHDLLRIGDIIDRGDRFSTALVTYALFRLLHQGRLWADLERQPLNYNLELQLCS